jgi:hypothetical protein
VLGVGPVSSRASIARLLSASNGRFYSACARWLANVRRIRLKKGSDARVVPTYG